MPRRNHVKKALGHAYNYLPERFGIKKAAKEIIKQGPRRVKEGKKLVDSRVDRVLWGKKRGK